MPSDRLPVRISGTVLEVERIHGIGRVSGAPYDFRQVHVLVGKASIASITWPDVLESPGEGEIVDWLVTVSASGGNLRVNYEQPWVSGAVLDTPKSSPVQAVKTG
jgi:hypothetical protein